MTCELCFTRLSFPYSHLGLILCMACVDELSELSCSAAESSCLHWQAPVNQQVAKVHSLFWYNGVVRSLTIKAKVKGDMSSLNRILQIWSAELENKSLFPDIDAVMPCPSSLWSRLHGRIDIAWFLAEKIAKRYEVKFLRPPKELYWKLKKRSQMERPEGSNLVETDGVHRQASDQKNMGHCLIVDDIVTTGSTLKTCIEHASKLGIGKFSSLTFARAR